MATQRILTNITPGDYNFKMADLMVAAMIKAYLQEMAEGKAAELLGSIVSPGMRDSEAPSIRAEKIPQEQWVLIDGAELAGLIESAKFLAMQAVEQFQTEKEERTFSRCLKFVKEDVFGALSGEKYVASMPVEMAEFITDCYLSAKA